MRHSLSLAVTVATFLARFVASQPAPEELVPLFDALARGPSTVHANLAPRVPLSTNDDTVSPLVDLQVYAPPVLPQGGTKCTVQLLQHDFGDGSYNNPTIVPYKPPTEDACGAPGGWAAITLNMTVFSNGTQYDRLSSLYLSHVEIWRHSSAEPTKTGTVWSVKDVTRYSALFATSGDLLMDFSNIISSDLGLDGVFHVTLTGTFYAPTQGFGRPQTPDLILPITNLLPNQSNYFTVADDAGGSASVLVPRTAQQAFVEIYASGNSAEEFWYLNTPDEYLVYFPESTGLIGKGPFREVQVAVDDKLAGVVWPHAVIYTGGITPTNWRPLTAYGTYDQPTYFVDVTPFLPLLADGAVHNITLRVRGQGENPSINSNWFVSGSLHLWLGNTEISGSITKYEAPANPLPQTTGAVSADNATVRTLVVANRSIVIESVLHGDKGTRLVRFEQQLDYRNEQKYTDAGWVQWGVQTTKGTTTSTHGGEPVLRDAFTYPLSVFSNYTLYEAQFGGYGSAVNQSYLRVLDSPVLGRGARSIVSIQHAEGTVGMDDWPGLRHAINGTGATDQQFAFTTSSGQTYFRSIAAKNDAWVRDSVWGSLQDEEPPVPKEQIFPGGGPGFRRMVGPGIVRRAR
ncbi:peptide N-acetyl-beta-D-glucosaminyl asparaginase amidase A-domain-containing protein [Dichomitus squalens]|uniref:Peptide N-acetyl-beta-D-glucosaminyl asparaginase amidase A-domain-containing protein n=1 Tax=Dichomitus squalens TaxID=114155 RepID=A0A4Q9P5A9_9APHY|nr:peptide N-acetyl-beta-D-glucosaminyl asparaginase amidase A-domain-containing protein [Dichomitus squalens]TBU49640.1 peptide N-acetyl-beta-D-glucosaminyl asparaginase amidase A-domain-containing protein [Dichomitus squalens]TBU64943.1 peptide N-acetyl-beta-D-glucosaminyl asparaginase amidase A-domain-containing protein [Dichomitus squalens]